MKLTNFKLMKPLAVVDRGKLKSWENSMLQDHGVEYCSSPHFDVSEGSICFACFSTSTEVKEFEATIENQFRDVDAPWDSAYQYKLSVEYHRLQKHEIPLFIMAAKEYNIGIYE
jgi:hypothetical protein